jgi:Zn-dependent protease
MKWKLGDVFGIGVYVHWSFWLLPAWIVLAGGAGPGGAFVSLLFVFAVFGCVVLHELGHALMARQLGIGTRDITLYPIGGVARLARMPRRPLHELAIAVAGPAVNVAIAAVLFAILVAAGIVSQGLFFQFNGGSFLMNLFAANVALVVFNMLPAFPMDGGRVLRAFLAMSLPYLRATEIAVRVGQVLAVVLGLVGLVSGSMLVLVALFVFLAAHAELSMARRSELAAPVVDAEAWTRHPEVWLQEHNGDIVWLETDDTGRGRVVRVTPISR